MTLDIVYPLTHLSKHRDDWELRYSLRSLQQQPWVGQLYLVGHCPGWVHNAIHVPCSDPYAGCKDANIINKILLICNLPGLSQEFVVNSDDQYFLQSVPEEELQPVLESPNRLAEYKMKSGINTWHRRVVDSVKWCVARKLPDWLFQSHVPYIVDKVQYPMAMSKVPWGNGNGFTTHIYFNLTATKEPEKESRGRTLRVKIRINEAELRKQTVGALFFNHNDNGLQPCVKNFLEERFPTPSRWEKT